MDDFTDYKYFKGETICPVNDYDKEYTWEVEKECYEKCLSFENRQKYMKESIEHTADHLGIIVKYPYNNL